MAYGALRLRKTPREIGELTPAQIKAIIDGDPNLREAKEKTGVTSLADVARLALEHRWKKEGRKPWL